MDDPTKSYLALIEKVDAFFIRVAERYTDEIRCAPGCDDCCRRTLSLFPFEVERMIAAAENLSEADLISVVHRARRATGSPEEPCPFLDAGLCLVYAVRPVICRTHGLPLLVPGEEKLSMCVYNLKGLKQLDGDCVLDLEPVNQILATVNHLVASRRGQSPERVMVSDAILERFDRGRPR